MYPILFQSSHFTIHTIWLFITASIIIGAYTLIKLSTKSSLKIQFLSDISWKLLLFYLIGARIVAIIVNHQTYLYEISKEAFFHLFFIWDKGLNLWGGFIAAGIYLYIACKKNEQNFLKWMDVIVPSVILAFAISHIGAFFEGIHYGRESSLPWAVNFESPEIKYTIPIHPTQIYAFVYSIALAVSLLFLSQYKKIKELDLPGIISIGGIGTYSFLNFLEQFMRGDDTWMLFGSIRVPQITNLLITISAGIILYLRYNSHKINKKK